MDWNMIQHAFLLGVLVQTTLAKVLTPTNVTLQCHNLHNVLRWNYDELSPELKFKVVVASETREPVDLWVKSPTLQVDLSNFSDPDDSYLASVSAVMGDDVSPLSQGISYSYSQLAFVQQTCTVDFPAVNVTVSEDSVIHLRFDHPWVLYNTDPKLKLPEFVYKVKVINQTKPAHEFKCKKKVCEVKKIPVDNTQEEYCVHVEGTVNKISVQPVQDYCSSSPEQTAETSQITSVLVGTFTLICIIIIIFGIMVCIKKSKGSAKLPDFLNVNGSNKKPFILERDPEKTCVVEVEPLSPISEADDITPLNTLPNDYEGRLPIGVQTEHPEVDDQAQATQQGVEEAGYEKGNVLDEDSSQNQDFCDSTGYEKRDRLN